MWISLNWYIGLGFPFGMLHWIEKQVPLMHIGMFMILAATVPLLKAWIWNVGKASIISSRRTTICLENHVEWRDVIHVPGMTSFTIVSSTIWITSPCKLTQMAGQTNPHGVLVCMGVKQSVDSGTRKQQKEVSWQCSMTSINVTYALTFIGTNCRNIWKVSISKGQLKCLILWLHLTHSLVIKIAPNVKWTKCKTLLALVLANTRWKNLSSTGPHCCHQLFIGWQGDGFAWTEGIWCHHNQPPWLFPKRAEAKLAPWQRGGWLLKDKGYVLCNANSCNQTATWYGWMKGLHKDFGFVFRQRVQQIFVRWIIFVGDKLRFYEKQKQGKDKTCLGDRTEQSTRDAHPPLYSIDNLDHMIKNASNWYIMWKYRHAPYLHAKSIRIIAAYDMYIECCDGLLS